MSGPSRLRTRALRGCIGLGFAGILLADVVTPADNVSICFAYAVPLAFGILDRVGSASVYAAIATLLSIAGSVIQPPPAGLMGVFIGNRIIAVIAQWLVAALIDYHQKVQRKSAADLVEERQKAQTSRRFLSILSHEIGTSLTTIDGQAFRMSRLADSLAAEDVRARVTKIRRSVGRIQHLAERVHLASEVGQGAISAQFARADLDEMLEEARRQTSDQAEPGRVTVEGAAPRPLSADASMLVQVFGNLIGNALKYSPRESPVVVRVRDDDFAVEVAVIDRGVGIAAEEQREIFKPYFRGANSHGVQGLGIGLYVSERFVAAHGGRIDVESQPGRGTTMIVRLPRAERS